MVRNCLLISRPDVPRYRISSFPLLWRLVLKRKALDETGPDETGPDWIGIG